MQYCKLGLHRKKAVLFVRWSIRAVAHFEVLKHTVNADLSCEQLDCVNKWLIEAIVNTIMQDRSAQGKAWKKIMNLSGKGFAF